MEDSNSNIPSYLSDQKNNSPRMKTGVS